MSPSACAAPSTPDELPAAGDCVALVLLAGTEPTDGVAEAAAVGALEGSVDAERVDDSEGSAPRESEAVAVTDGVVKNDELGELEAVTDAEAPSDSVAVDEAVDEPVLVVLLVAVLDDVVCGRRSERGRLGEVSSGVW